MGVAAAACIGVCGYLFYTKGDFDSQFTTRPVTKGQEFGEIPLRRVEDARKRLLEVFHWEPPIKSNKPVPLNKSVLIVLKEGELIDMFLENPPLREPMTNEYLRKYELDALAPNVSELDPDGDGFSNLEEFVLKTNPKDSDPTHKDAVPPAKNKIYFVSREQDDYKLILGSSSMPLQVRRTFPIPAKADYVEALPQDVEFELGSVARFQALNFTPKKVPDPRLGEKDVSELTLLDRSTNSEVVLVFREEKNLASYKAKIQFRLKTVQERVVKKGDIFRFEGVPSSFRLEDVTETGATISEQDASGAWGQPWAISPRP
ncbi:MAG: hypothetical protein JNJ83_24760 [Verrucomicrobiaceae bacterium]|nr:hypothetical protein [Verrucomicrobiaceae bacterium]